MIREEIFIMTMYEAPPEDIEMADQRMQLLFARDLIPKDKEDAEKRMKLAGCYPTNLIGMIWESVDQFTYLLKDRGWDVHTEVILDSGDRSRVHAGYAELKESRFVFVLEQMPHRTRVVGARLVKTSKEHKNWLHKVQALMGDCDD